ncbi:hypothetical protein EVAR_44275_1 [Eumeta japonica]|uniref:Uncharacterized protein n=1 Tax=Eumeta variegata TaxID=151549 RepID=A0A4C1WT39_EUMVA|nr:hypothetical protein EVAR_44275_1 [Eumeta japonica]
MQVRLHDSDSRQIHRFGLLCPCEELNVSRFPQDALHPRFSRQSTTVDGQSSCGTKAIRVCALIATLGSHVDRSISGIIYRNFDATAQACFARFTSTRVTTANDIVATAIDAILESRAIAPSKKRGAQDWHWARDRIEPTGKSKLESKTSLGLAHMTVRIFDPRFKVERPTVELSSTNPMRPVINLPHVPTSVPQHEDSRSATRYIVTAALRLGLWLPVSSDIYDLRIRLHIQQAVSSRAGGKGTVQHYRYREAPMHLCVNAYGYLLQYIRSLVECECMHERIITQRLQPLRTVGAIMRHRPLMPPRPATAPSNAQICYNVTKTSFCWPSVRGYRKAHKSRPPFYARYFWFRKCLCGGRETREHGRENFLLTLG